MQSDEGEPESGWSLGLTLELNHSNAQVSVVEIDRIGLGS